jgi:hypothetical protein
MTAQKPQNLTRRNLIAATAATPFAALPVPVPAAPAGSSPSYAKAYSEGYRAALVLIMAEIMRINNLRDDEARE